MSEASISVFSLLMIITFVLGYFFITIEHITKINKTLIAPPNGYHLLGFAIYQQSRVERK